MFKLSLLLKIDLQNTKNIATKLNWKLFTKVIKRPSKEAWGLVRNRVLLKEECKRFNLENVGRESY